MKSIWKFPLGIVGLSTVEMPKGAEILTIQTQYGSPCMWAIVETSAELERRHFYVFGTGHPFHLPEYTYIGTVQMHADSLVWHVFETTPVTT